MSSCSTVLTPSCSSCLATGRGSRSGQAEATLTLDPADLSRLAATLKAQAGHYMAPEGVVWQVERTEITDEDGNVIETIG